MDYITYELIYGSRKITVQISTKAFMDKVSLEPTNEILKNNNIFRSICLDTKYINTFINSNNYDKLINALIEMDEILKDKNAFDVIQNEYFNNKSLDEIREILFDNYVNFLNTHKEKINLLTIFSRIIYLHKICNYAYEPNVKYIEELYKRGLADLYTNEYLRYNVVTINLDLFNMTVKYCPKLYFCSKIIKSMFNDVINRNCYRSINCYKCLLALIDHNISNNINTSNMFVNEQGRKTMINIISHLEKQIAESELDKNTKELCFIGRYIFHDLFYLCAECHEIEYGKFLIDNVLEIDQYQYTPPEDIGSDERLELLLEGIPEEETEFKYLTKVEEDTYIAREFVWCIEHDQLELCEHMIKSDFTSYITIDTYNKCNSPELKAKIKEYVRIGHFYW